MSDGREVFYVLDDEPAWHPHSASGAAAGAKAPPPPALARQKMWLHAAGYRALTRKGSWVGMRAHEWGAHVGCPCAQGGGKG